MLAAGAAPCLSCSGEPCRGACPHGVPIERFTAQTHRMLTS
jgi:hypothetical protein